ncbi:histidine phosphatase family protein [Undibacterium sp. Ren11W]|uniref:histidine phosphatase family protein n=1 Tax=Undibacterium sp. Ren11W TaxID=3413045 RepID=UPI003BF0A2F3
MLLHLIRHPKLDIAPDICYGQSDIPANHVHCTQIADELRMLLPVNLSVISSPLQRCHVLARMLHHAPVIDARLMEKNFGAWEMRSWENIARAEIDAWVLDVVGYVPFGGESVLMMAKRVLDFLTSLPMCRELEGTETVLVTHGGPLSMILAYQFGMSAEDLANAVAMKRKNLDFGDCVQVQIKLC